MKKIVCLTMVMLCVFVGQVRSNFTLQDYFIGEYYSFTDGPINENSLSLGFCYMNKNIGSKKLVGEKIVCKNLEIGTALKSLKAKVIETETVDDMNIIYAYSPLINSSINIDNKLINLQLVEKLDLCIIGWPVILSDY